MINQLVKHCILYHTFSWIYFHINRNTNTNHKDFILQSITKFSITKVPPTNQQSKRIDTVSTSKSEKCPPTTYHLVWRHLQNTTDLALVYHRYLDRIHKQHATNMMFLWLASICSQTTSQLINNYSFSFSFLLHKEWSKARDGHPAPAQRLAYASSNYFGYQIKRFAWDGFGSNNLPEFSQKIQYDNADLLI